MYIVPSELDSLHLRLIKDDLALRSVQYCVLLIC